MEQQLKERLVGGAALVVVAVIFLPIILDGHPPEEAARPQMIPAPDETKFVQPVVAEPSPEEVPEQEAMPVSEQYGLAPEEEIIADIESTHEAVPPPVETEWVPEPEEELGTLADADAATAPELALSPQTPSEPAAEHYGQNTAMVSWVVQAGSFLQRGNAEKLEEELRGKGYRAFVETYTESNGEEMHQVRIGPELQRSAAEQTLKKLRDENIRGIRNDMMIRKVEM